MLFRASYQPFLRCLQIIGLSFVTFDKELGEYTIKKYGWSYSIFCCISSHFILYIKHDSEWNDFTEKRRLLENLHKFDVFVWVHTTISFFINNFIFAWSMVKFLNKYAKNYQKIFKLVDYAESKFQINIKWMIGSSFVYLFCLSSVTSLSSKIVISGPKSVFLKFFQALSSSSIYLFGSFHEIVLLISLLKACSVINKTLTQTTPTSKTMKALIECHGSLLELCENLTIMFQITIVTQLISVHLLLALHLFYNIDGLICTSNIATTCTFQFQFVATIWKIVHFIIFCACFFRNKISIEVGTVDF